MRTLGNRNFMLVCTALTTVLLIVGAGVASNSGRYQQDQQQFDDQTSQQQGFQSDDQMGSQDQQDQQQFGTQVPQQQGDQGEDQTSWQDQQQFGTQQPQDYQRDQMDTQRQQRSQAGMQGNRNQPLERQVASQLRDHGLGQQGQLLVLALGNRVILLGAAPNQNEKQQAEQISSQVSGVGQVDNRIVVLSQARRKSDTQLQQDIQQQLSRLPNGVGQNIQVQARNGRIILRGRVTNWSEMANAIQAAFNAGASYVVSQITTGQMDRSYGRTDQDRFGAGQQDQGGYAAGQQDRSRYVTDWQDQSRSGTSRQTQQDRYGTRQSGQDSDYGRGTTDQYGQYGYQAPQDRAYGQTYDQDRDQDSQYDRYDSSRYQGDMDRRTDQYGRFGGRTTARDRWRQTSQDHRMEQQLTSELRSDVQGLDDVTVLVAGNKVFIFGRAQNQSAKDRATSLAKEISGVQRVQNNLTVSTRGMQRLDDSTLRSNITDELQSSPYLDNPDRIRVNVRNGTATLSGQVDSFGELAATIQSAYEAGARSVRHRITISGQTTAERDSESGYYPPYGYGADQSTSGGLDTQSGTSDQSTSGGSGAQSGSSRSSGSTSGQSTSGRVTTQNVAYRTGGGSSGQSMSGRSRNQSDQDDSYPSYGYTPSESDEDEWQDTDDEDTAQTGRQGRSRDDFTPPSRQQGQMGRQRTSTSDMVLAQRIALELQRQIPNIQNIHVLNPHAIYVLLNRGTVTLHGHVQDDNLKQQAEQIARSTRGVQNVQNQLIVAGQAGAFPPFGYVPGQQGTTQSGSSMGTGRQSTTGQQSTFGQPSTTGQRSTSRQPSSTGQSQTGFQQMSSSDKLLARQVALELQQQFPGSEIVYVMDPQAINVMVSEGTVMLHGAVQDQNMKQQAEQIARSVSGARNIHNDLIIMGQPQQRQTTGQQQQMPMTSTDRRLAQQIQQQLQQRFPDSNINVTINRGTATLHGTVQDQNQKQQAEQIAKSMGGVQSVQNNLTVSAGQGEFPPLGYTPGQDDSSQQDTGISSGTDSPDQSQPY